MKRLLMLTVLLAACFAQAGTIQDLRGGVIPEGSIVTVGDAVVTAVMDHSFVVSEQEAGPSRSVWVYEGEVPSVSVGDVVEVFGTYLELNGRATISLLHPATAGYVVTGSAELPRNDVTVLMLLNDPEAWETTLVHVTDGLIVQEVLPNGQWLVASYESGTQMILDDYFRLFPNVMMAECYNNADGIFFYYDGVHVLKTLDVEYVDCTVGNEVRTFGEIKSIYR